MPLIAPHSGARFFCLPQRLFAAILGLQSAVLWGSLRLGPGGARWFLEQ